MLSHLPPARLGTLAVLWRAFLMMLFGTMAILLIFRPHL